VEHAVRERVDSRVRFAKEVRRNFKQGVRKNKTRGNGYRGASAGTRRNKLENGIKEKERKREREGGSVARPFL